MLPKHGFWPLNYIPLVLLVGVEPTTKQILSLSPLPIGLQEQILVLLAGIVDAERLPTGYPQLTVFETAASFSWATRAEFDSPARGRTWNLRLQRALCCQLHHRALLPGQGLNLQPHRSERCDFPIRPPGNEWLPQ